MFEDLTDEDLMNLYRARALQWDPTDDPYLRAILQELGRRQMARWDQHYREGDA